MAIVASTIVPTSVQRGLSDKLYEKRKNAALEIEGITKKLAASGDHDKIAALIKMLTDDFTYSAQVHNRKGGLIGLAAVTVGLTTEAGPHLDLKYFMSDHLENIIPPVVNSFLDHDSRVRYYACEALYNIAKVVRGEFIVFFNRIFDALCKLSADSDANVQSAAHLLDRLIKDIVTESDSFSIEEFVPLLKERMNVLSPYVRQFLVGWITVLDSVPDIAMIGFLPDFLDGLFNMLSDSSLEIRQQADAALSEFLYEIKNSPVSPNPPNVDYGRMAEILVRRCGSTDEFTRLTAVIWVNEFVNLGGDQLVAHYADIVGAILPCISDKEEKIRAIASETNKELRKLKPDPSEGFDVGKVLQIARRELNSYHGPTRIEAMRWIQNLVLKYQNEIIIHMDDIFISLLSSLSDPLEELVLLVLEVHACVAQETRHFTDLLTHLLCNFKSNNYLLEKRGPLIVQRLCKLLGAERVYCEFSAILGKESDLGFADTMIQVLNLILVTSAELSGLRATLRQALVNSSGKELFLSLYPSWCHSSMATITICFLAQAYYLANCIIQSLKEEDIDIRFLVHLDKLVRLLETPIFSYLRLQLLEPEKHTWLVKCLYGLLMLLPQTPDLYSKTSDEGFISKQRLAFKILRTRLKTVPMSRLSDAMAQPSPAHNSIPIRTEDDSCNPRQDTASIYHSINFQAQLDQFVQKQEQQHQFAKSKLPLTDDLDSGLKSSRPSAQEAVREFTMMKYLTNTYVPKPDPIEVTSTEDVLSPEAYGPHSAPNLRHPDIM
ncbi:protein VAC14 isoform X1 [Carex littledalei]|uniref:Protein VAC14 isoform X1 n=1 Tax=Carex littledalei TaxID=544730 RepID=A0A833UY54_9POAL|nr:protein VAC14 isoform X1 [Carex littledalei]